jgi:hypothetical protein
MTIEEMEAEIQETNELIRKRRRRGMGLMLKPLWMLMCLMVSSVNGFTAYDCSNQSNVVESYSLLEQDACANMGRDGEVETTVYGEIVHDQAGQDDSGVHVYGSRDPRGTVLRDVLGSRGDLVHQIPGT